jgi:uncharacterized protein YegL
VVLPSHRPRKKPAPNPEPRCPAVIIADVSRSMSGPKGDALNAAMARFLEEIRRDDLAAHRIELAVVTIGNGVKVTLDFAAVADIEKVPTFAFDGNTPLASGILKALELVQTRKAHFKTQGIDVPYRPWVVLITDGAPTDQDIIPKAREALFQAVGHHRLTFYPVGVHGADFEFLKSICPAGQKVYELEGLKFAQFFQWLSRSLTSASHEDPDEEPEVEEPDGVQEVR